MRRPFGLSLLVSLLTAFAAAQPPVPLYGAIPTEAESVAPMVAVDATEPIVDELGDAARVAKEHETRLASELAGLTARRTEAGQRLRQRARALYRIRRNGSINLTGGFDALLARTGRLERLERVVVDDARRLTDYRRRERLMTTELENAHAATERAEQRKHDSDVQRASIEAQLGYTDVGAGYGTLPPLPVAPMATPGPDLYQPSATIPAQQNGFALLRGRLGLPVTASIGMRDAVRDDGPGVEFVARPGTIVMVVAEGRIAFAGEYGSYGRMIIVDHGDTFYTIYAGLGRISARVGDWMTRGASIGEVGGGANSALFFEVRRGTRSLDTRNWIGLAR